MSWRASGDTLQNEHLKINSPHSHPALEQSRGTAGSQTQLSSEVETRCALTARGITPTKDAEETKLQLPPSGHRHQDGLDLELYVKINGPFLP